ncbi:MAG: minor capsid protein [Lachnospiraceae bacterium]|nr:minor capsid protein [Lachnospiraceae bacterium]
MADGYWKNRMEATFLAGEKTAQELSVSLRTAYEEAARGIEKEIEAFYGRYAGMNGLSIVDVKKRLNPNELKSYAEETKRYYDMVDPSKIGKDMAESYRKELRYQSARSYMSRLEALKTDLKHIVVDLGGKERQGMETTLEKIYSDTYAMTRCAADVYRGFSTGFARLNHEQLNSAVHQKWLGSEFSGRVWQDKGKLIDSLNTTFLQGVARGQNPRKIAEQMSESLGANYSACERLVRTETAHIANMATMKGYKDSGIKSYKILATLDSRTSEICRDYDGKVFDVKDMEVGVNAPPFHPNCRTTTVAHFEPDEIDAMFEEAQRVARNEGGKLYYVPASTTYRQWEGMMSKPPAMGLKKTLELWKKDKKDDYPKHESCNIAEQCGMEFYESVHETAKNCANEDLKHIWEIIEDKIVIGSTNARVGGAYFLPSKMQIFFNKQDDFLSSAGKRSKHSTFFHEAGHFLDKFATKEKAVFSYFSNEFQNGVLAKTIREEADDFIQKRYDKMNKDFLAHRNDMDYLKKHGLIKIGFETAEKVGKKLKKELVYKSIEKELFSLPQNTRDCVSDLFSGATLNKVEDGGIHPTSYWKSNQNGLLATEATAEFFSSAFTNSDSYDTMKKYFPKSEKVFVEMMKNLRNSLSEQ